MNERAKTYQLLKSSISFLFCFVVANFVCAQQKVLNVNKNVSSVPIGKYVYIYRDAQSIYKDSEIIHISQFQLPDKDIPVFPKVTSGNIWAKFKVVNSTA